MFFRILKKDLKRKKTMNVILLLFVIISAMFVAASVNNIFTVVSGLDYYFDKAGLDGNYFVISRSRKGDNSIEEALDKESFVKDYRIEEFIYANSTDVLHDGKKAFEYQNISLVVSVDKAAIRYFDKDNNSIDKVNEGEVYVNNSILKKSKLSVGDEIEIKLYGVSVKFKIAGIAKDALLGSDFMGNPRYIINDKDYEKFKSNDEVFSKSFGKIYYIDTEDVNALKEMLSAKDGILFDGDMGLIRMTYVMNMIVAGVLLIISLGLILVSFTMLRFTIGFTITEEFREIGVMKAVGIKNSAIRRLYITKYFAIAVLGAVIGFFGSIPFGNILLKSVSENMVLGNENSMIVGLLSAVLVVFLIIWFAYSSTGKIKKMSPIDAVRSGQTGERYGKKGFLSLGKSKLSPTGFLAANDVLSSKKQFGIMTIVFTICLLLVMILANTANTLCSEKLIYLFGTVKSDVYMTDGKRIMELMDGGTGNEKIYDTLNEIEEKLAQNDMPGKVIIELQYKYSVTFNGKTQKLTFQQNKLTKASDYVYNEGSAPQNEYEIALTPQSAGTIGCKIGDTVSIKINGVEHDYMVTGLFTSFNQLGQIGRLHEDAKTDRSEIVSSFSFQIDFDDNPDDETIDERIERLKVIFDTKDVCNAADYTNNSTGVSGTMRAVEYLALVLTVIISALIAILMERSFISREKSEIALMKAVGIKNKRIIIQHTLRFVIVMVLAIIIAALLAVPMTKLCVNPIFGLMGVAYSLEYEIKPLEIFIICPLIILVTTTISAFLTALYTNTIKAYHTADIE
ncbi:MAG: FtsX-like permease family protein [Lachnospiraceae bacterium]|nr:FtsX-like permease family protein [Lachnospiraceae bacterium]